MSSDKKAILVVSFGTSYNENRVKTIDAVESLIGKEYPDWEVRRAFTSKIVIKKLAKRDGLIVDYVDDAMERLISDDVKTVVIQPTHIMNGLEYDDVVRIVSKYANSFDSLSIGSPLLTSNEDYDVAVDALRDTILKEAKDIKKDAAVVLMGHGTEHHANAAYCELHMKLMLSDCPDVYVTTVEGFPSFDDTITLMGDNGYKEVVLVPFMLVAGDHATNDMAGDDDDSLKTMFERNGYKVHCIVKGLGEYDAFRRIFLEHTRSAIEHLYISGEEVI